MTDRELLELAAKAAGIVWYGAAGEEFDGCTYFDIGEDEVVKWNPLLDDGDALRLAVKLLFEIDMGRGCIAIRHSTGIKILEAFNHDPLTATRRAIVRAAAEIGRQR
jgi:hypothetical protein